MGLIPKQRTIHLPFCAAARRFALRALRPSETIYIARQMSQLEFRDLSRHGVAKRTVFDET
jgi:hypothetical protein